MESRLLFLHKFLREGKRIASLAPSSKALARAACRGVTPDTPQTIVELGAGTGAVTEIVLATVHPRSRIIAVELDPEFAEILRRRCPRAIVIEGDAVDLARHLEPLGVERIDLLISGLALPSLPPDGRRSVLESFARLSRPGAWFSQLTVMPLVFLGFYRRLFREVRFDWALWNAPPGGVYHCRSLRTAHATPTGGES